MIVAVKPPITNIIFVDASTIITLEFMWSTGHWWCRAGSCCRMLWKKWLWGSYTIASHLTIQICRTFGNPGIKNWQSLSWYLLAYSWWYAEKTVDENFFFMPTMLNTLKRWCSGLAPLESIDGNLTNISAEAFTDLNVIYGNIRGCTAAHSSFKHNL